MRKWIRACCIIFLLFMSGVKVYAQEAELEAEIEQVQESLFSYFDFDELNELMGELYPEEKMDFFETVKAMISGKIEVCADTVNQLVLDQVNYAFRTNRKLLGQMLILMIFSAVFTNFSNVFENKQIAEIGFYMIYMLMLTMGVKSFDIAVQWAEEGIRHLTTFMEVLYPMYFLAVSLSKGLASSSTFYGLALLLIFLVEYVILTVLLPMIQVYIMVRFMNGISEEEYLSKFSELMETGAGWILKALLGIVIGLNIIQGMIAPAIDTVKRSVVSRSAEAIPGIGDALGGATEVVLGTAVLVKNGIGAAGAVVSIGICVIPVIQILMLTVFYKVSAAIVQPVADKRMVECISSVGEGCQLLLKVIFAVAVLFLLTIAIVSSATS